MAAVAKQAATPSVIALTAKQKIVFDFIKSFMAEHRYSPTLKQIATRMRCKNAGSIVCHLEALEAKGLIKREPNKARTIEIIAG